MFKRVFILMPLILGLMMFSCSLQEPSDTASSIKFEEIEFADLVEMQEFNTAEAEANNVVGLTMNFAFESWDAHQEVVAMEINAASLAKTASDWVYSWNGNVHSWSMLVEDEAYHGEFYKEVYYVDENMQLVESPSDAHYMFTINRAKGAYGFVGESPENQYGITFSHVLNSKWFNMQSADRFMTAQGNYTKTNRLIYNGKNALLKSNLRIEIEEMSFDDSDGSMAVVGMAKIDMRPWTVDVECNGTNMAQVTIYDGKRVHSQFEYDLTNIQSNGMGF